MAFYTLVIVVLYPQFQNSTGLESIVKKAPTLSALFGVIGSFTSPAGWLNANIYENFFPLLMLLLTIGYGASAIAGQDEGGLLALVASLPVRRSVLLMQKVLAMAAQAFLLSLAVAVVVVAGRPFHLHLPIGNIAGVSLGVLLLGLDFGLLAMAIGAATGRRGTAIGVGASVATASYLIGSLAPVVRWVHPARFVSLFYWSVGNDQLSGGTSLWDILVLVVVGAVGLAVSIRLFERQDLH